MLITLNGTRIAFEDFGNGPAVILLHDLPLCREMWWPQLDELARQNYRVIAPDIRGFGESESDHRPFSVSLCCRDIIGLMRYLGIGRAVFVGIGAANYLISELQRFYPNRVAAICMISPQTAITDRLTRHRSRDLAARIQAGKRLSVIDCLCKEFLP